MSTLIVLIGPTGVGKTELSLRLEKHFRQALYLPIRDSFMPN